MLKKIWNRKNTLGYIALALACLMVGGLLGTAAQPAQAADSVMTASTSSPFTEAIAKVKDSVVGVNNYQLVRNNYGYGNGYGNSFGFPWSDFFGYGYGSPYGNGNQDSDREVKYGSGSGVVVANEYVMTNYHVVDGASSLEVSVEREGKSDPDLFKATVAACDQDLDVAVLYVPGLDLAPVALGDSDSLQVGELVFNIGNPIGFNKTVTAGIISGLNREINTDTHTDRYGRTTNVVNTMIQTDAAINSGNSGGGMFNLNGELVGIPTLKYTGSRYSSSATVESIGMCIPVNDAKAVIEKGLNADTSAGVSSSQDSSAQNSASGTVRNDLQGRPRMGVIVTTLSGAAVQNGILPRGVYVTEVESGSPAEQAGLQPYDIIVEANGTVLTTTTDLTSIIGSLKEGDQVALKVYRTGVDLYNTTDIPTDGEYVDLTLTLAIVDAIAQ
ncbi:MAG: trypsin-like peptidase domain-containing protein [Clostridia bacterium]|nr:trypsin-like peptidase domain-containing protein [Clostridia bacterium]